MTDAAAQPSGPLERCALGLIGMGGLVAAAAISALPDSQCSAIAATYYHAIDFFGGAAMAGLLILGLAMLPMRNAQSDAAVAFRALIAMLAVGGIVGLFLGVYVCEQNLKRSIQICWKDDSAAAEARQGGILGWFMDLSD
ncbi:MAG TPA: hypothetical protein VG889_17515 [Rhizomicrobium sp.]|nr:hypothetical protein [Rhizomicrobium sp.]